MAGRKKYKKNEDFFKSWSPQMAYTLGLIISDGCIQKGNRGQWVLRIVNSERYLLEAAKQFMEVENPIYHRTYKSKNRKTSTGYVLQIGSKKICNDLIKLGITERKSLTVEFPEVPNKYLPYFLQGVIDGDGSVYIANSKVTSPINRIPPLKYKEYHYKILVISVASGSQKFLDGLKSVLPTFNRCKWHVSVNSNKALKLGKWIYANPQVKSRKYLVYKKATQLKGSG